MISQHPTDTAPEPRTNLFAAADVQAILRERGWMGDSQRACAAVAAHDLDTGAAPEKLAESSDWLAQAAILLGPQVATREALAELLSLVFHYDAAAILTRPENHAVLMREGAREVIRELALQVLDGPEVDSDRFKEIIGALKEKLPYRGRELFHPIRLALAGRAGEGELDRVTLLLDSATRLPSAITVKGARQRMLEFCAALE